MYQKNVDENMFPNHENNVATKNNTQKNINIDTKWYASLCCLDNKNETQK